jgi:hypothetical protein
MARTANDRDLDGHMDLISRQIALFGVPGFEVLGYEDWQAQCAHEFTTGLLARVSYQGLRLIAETETRIMFMTVETVEATDGTVNVSGVEAILELEPDATWRLVQERVLPSDELDDQQARGRL